MTLVGDSIKGRDFDVLWDIISDVVQIQKKKEPSLTFRLAYVQTALATLGSEAN
jgi:hypothetical protein